MIQYGTPEEILTNPINEFVSDFIGHDRLVKKLSLFTVERICRPVKCTVTERELAGAAQKISDSNSEVCFLIDDSGRAVGLLNRSDFNKGASPESLKQLALSRQETLIQGSMVLRDALSILLEYGIEALGVLHGDEPIGSISLTNIRDFSTHKEEHNGGSPADIAVSPSAKEGD